MTIKTTFTKGINLLPTFTPYGIQWSFFVVFFRKNAIIKNVIYFLPWILISWSDGLKISIGWFNAMKIFCFIKEKKE